jgi:hypothetical protein
MPGVAPVRSHYARLAGESAGHADQTRLPDPVWRSRRSPMGLRAAAMPVRLMGSWEHFRLALICHDSLASKIYKAAATYVYYYGIKNPARSQHRAAIATRRSVAAAREGPTALREFLAAATAVALSGDHSGCQLEWPQCPRRPSPATRLFVVTVTGLSPAGRGLQDRARPT